MDVIRAQTARDDAGRPEPAQRVRRALDQAPFLLYLSLIFFANFANRAISGEEALSVSYPLLGLLLLMGITRARRRTIPVRALGAVALGVLAAAVTIGHFADGLDPERLQFIAYFVLAPILGHAVPRVHERRIEAILIGVSAIFLATGLIAWWLSVRTGSVSTLSFYHHMVFAKQDYTLVFTCVAGLFLYELQRRRTTGRLRIARTAYYTAALVIAGLLFFIKSIFVVVALGYVGLTLLHLLRRRRLALLLLLASVAWGLFAVGAVSVRWLPDNLQPFVRYAAGQPISTGEGRYLDSLLIRREILLENGAALLQSPATALFGLGGNAVAAREEPFASPFSNRTYSLPQALESGLLWIVVMTGVVGLVVALLFFWLPLAAVAQRVRRRPDRFDLSLLVCVGMALLASNVFQDNTNSLLWAWFGILWTREPSPPAEAPDVAFPLPGSAATSPASDASRS